MASSAMTVSTLLPQSSRINSKSFDANPRIAHPSNRKSSAIKHKNKPISLFSAFPPHFCIIRNAGFHTYLSPTAAAASSSSVATSEYAEEPETKVKFPTSQSLPGCSSSLSLLGTGYREKVFAIIGVKVYAAGFYMNQSIFGNLDAWKGLSSAYLQKDKSLFDAIFQAPLEKSLRIILVRDVDGKIFWDALDEAVSPRIKSPTTVDDSALSTFRSIFQDRPLKKGTSIFLTWLDTTKMLVCVSPDGNPSSVDATIESSNVTYSLFDVFLGGNPVSPSLKASACSGLAAILK